MIPWFFLGILFFASYLLTWVVRHLAIRKSILDIPNHRSSHSIPIPRGGGLAFALVWFVGISVFYFWGRIETPLYLAFLCGIPLSLIGLFDDIKPVKPVYRSLIQFLSAAGALFFLGGLQSFDLGCYRIDSTLLLSLPALIGIVWAINLFNFIDGIDGYIGSETAFLGLSGFILLGDPNGLILLSISLGFLVWNWPKAKIFMGDVGSTLIGFTIAIWAIYHQNQQTSSLLIWVILSSVFWFDATLTLFRRWRNHEVLSEAHRKHAYQRIVQSGWSHQKTTLSAVFINILLLAIAWASMQIPEFIFLFFLLAILLLAIIQYRIDKKMPFPR